MPGRVHLSKSAFDKALDQNASKYYRLSIQFSLDGFSFCIYDINRNKFSGIEIYDFQGVSNYLGLANLIREFIPKTEWLSLDYESVSIAFETPVCTLVPSPLFKDTHANDYLKLNFNLQLDDLIKNDHLSLLDANNIWSIPHNIYKRITKFFPKAQIHHHASSLIENLLLHNKNRESGEVVFVNVRKNWFDIVVLDGNKLLFYNAFRYKAKEDFIYFLIFVLEQLNLNPEITDVVLLGEVLKISSVYEVAYKYIRNISFGKRSNDYQYSYVIDEMPEHFYFNLIHLQQCEL